ncbi:MAG: ABC transporter permease, partial [Clostridiales Family XIII bacterium]|nr:ABC transporter permease [Clostridiales Family XIII bacterium]
SSADEIAKLTEKSLSDTVKVENLGTSKSGIENLNNFYNIFVYGVLGSLVMGIGIAMMALNERKLYLRTAVSPVSIRRRNTALFSAQACFGAAIWLIGALLSLYFAGDARLSPAHIMFIVNSIPFVLSVTALGFLIGQAVKNETVFSGVSTVLMLCVSFLSGAFIPQQFLADSVLKISALTPAYWYIVNNNKIGRMSEYDFGALLGPMAVMLGFTVLLVLAGTLITVVKARKKLA